MASFTEGNFDFTGQVASVPEPASLWIFLVGLTLVGFASLRRVAERAAMAPGRNGMRSGKQFRAR